MNYPLTRRLFGEFKERLAKDPELADEYERAILMLRSNYNTAIRENRFIVGGAVEHITVAAFNGAGMPAHHVGAGDTRIDVRVANREGDVGYSTKASFSGMNVRLINKLGSSETEWLEPTLFFFEGVGIVYADPELLPDATKQEDDALVLDGKKMKEYIKEHPEYIIPIRFEKPTDGSIPSSKTASEDVARTIIKNFNHLSLP